MCYRAFLDIKYFILLLFQNFYESEGRKTVIIRRASEDSEKG
jgi:hypothetical protein